MRDYSGGGEQAAILEWAAANPRGSFIDLGAYDGEYLSNTAALGDLGWSGICIDAAPDAVEACRARYADRPDVRVRHAAFSLDYGRDYVTIQWTPGAVYSGLEASAREDVTPEPVEVERLGLGWFTNVIRKLPRPVFCSIDLEGASLDALAWLLARTELDCICVEANNPGDREVARELLADWREIPLPGNDVNLLFARV